MSALEKFADLELCEKHGKNLMDDCEACSSTWKAATDIAADAFQEVDKAGENLMRVSKVGITSEVALAVQIQSLVDVLIPNPLDRVVYETTYAESMLAEIKERTKQATKARLVTPSHGGRIV